MIEFGRMARLTAEYRLRSNFAMDQGCVEQSAGQIRYVMGGLLTD
jgi:hypothetical protein